MEIIEGQISVLDTRDWIKEGKKAKSQIKVLPLEF